MLKSLQIEDLCKELCTDPHMALICEAPLPEDLAQFCKEHYGIRPVFKKVASWFDSRYKNDLGIYLLDQQLSRADQANNQ